MTNTTVGNFCHHSSLKYTLQKINVAKPSNLLHIKAWVRQRQNLYHWQLDQSLHALIRTHVCYVAEVGRTWNNPRLSFQSTTATNKQFTRHLMLHCRFHSAYLPLNYSHTPTPNPIPDPKPNPNPNPNPNPHGYQCNIHEVTRKNSHVKQEPKAVA